MTDSGDENSNDVSYWENSAPMSHKLAKLLLEQAETFLERRDAVKEAIKLGMPIEEVEEYLDWLEMIRCQPQNASEISDVQSDG